MNENREDGMKSAEYGVQFRRKCLTPLASKTLWFLRNTALLMYFLLKFLPGFQLSGKVVEKGESKCGTQQEEYSVSVGFDRCKITEVSCTCGNKDIYGALML